MKIMGWLSDETILIFKNVFLSHFFLGWVVRLSIHAPVECHVAGDIRSSADTSK